MDQRQNLPEFRRYNAESQVGQGAFGTVYLANKKPLEVYIEERQRTRRERQEREGGGAGTASPTSSPTTSKTADDNANNGADVAQDTGSLSGGLEADGKAPTNGSADSPQHRTNTATPHSGGTPQSPGTPNTTRPAPLAAAGGNRIPEGSVEIDSNTNKKSPLEGEKRTDEQDYEDEPNKVAIKVIPNYARNEEFARRVWLELAILHAGQAIPQVVPMYHIDCTTTYVEESMPAGTPTTSNYAAGAGNSNEGSPTHPSASAATKRIPQYNLHVTMDYVPYDLANLIGKRAINSENKIRSVICQLLLGINALAERNCVHRDLSSRNVLVTNELSVFICDFGLARLYDPDEQMSYGVITQWYRAPEVLLDCKYDSQVDVWAVGVMMAELFLQGHLFMGRNKDVVHQLNCILDFTGFSSPEWLEENGDLSSASSNAKAYMKKQRIKHKGVDSLKYRLEPSAAAKDMLANLLQFNPKQRWSARRCLEEHPWFTSEPEIKSYISQQLEYIDGVENPFTMVGDNVQGYGKRINEILKLYEEE